MDRLLAFGDIHGCRVQLEELLDRVGPTVDDRLVFLGDYIDRGPDSYGVIERLLHLEAELPQTVFLMGNHERMLLDGWDTADPLWLFNGGDATLASYRKAGHATLPVRHRHFFDSLRLYHEVEDFIFVHAGLRPGMPPAAQQERDLLWIRGEFLDSNYSWGKTVVFGHTPLERPWLTPERIGLDTGAVYGRELTCCDVRTRQLWSA